MSTFLILNILFLFIYFINTIHIRSEAESDPININNIWNNFTYFEGFPYTCDKITVAMDPIDISDFDTPKQVGDKYTSSDDKYDYITAKYLSEFPLANQLSTPKYKFFIITQITLKTQPTPPEADKSGNINNIAEGDTSNTKSYHIEVYDVDNIKEENNYIKCDIKRDHYYYIKNNGIELFRKGCDENYIKEQCEMKTIYIRTVDLTEFTVTANEQDTIPKYADNCTVSKGGLSGFHSEVSGLILIISAYNPSNYHNHNNKDDQKTQTISEDELNDIRITCGNSTHYITTYIYKNKKLCQIYKNNYNNEVTVIKLSNIRINPIKNDVYSNYYGHKALYTITSEGNDIIKGKRSPKKQKCNSGYSGLCDLDEELYLEKYNNIYSIYYNDLYLGSSNNNKVPLDISRNIILNVDDEYLYCFLGMENSDNINYQLINYLLLIIILIISI